MDLTMLDVGHIPGVRVQDEVVVLGRQDGERITADDIALQLDTINYEVVSSVMERVPRIYVEGAGRKATRFRPNADRPEKLKVH